jgi:hypothetical protein
VPPVLILFGLSISSCAVTVHSCSYMHSATQLDPACRCWHLCLLLQQCFNFWPALEFMTMLMVMCPPLLYPQAWSTSASQEDSTQAEVGCGDTNALR